MKGLLISVLLAIAVWPSASVVLSQTMVASIGRDQAEPGAPGGGKPIDTPVATRTDPNQEDGVMNQAQLLAQAGAIGILAVVLFFYRRDFFTKNDREKAEAEEREKEQKADRDQLAALIKDSNACIRESAVATARQTDATHRLARTVENIERRASSGGSV